MEQKSLASKPTYLQTWLIALMFAFWFLIIPFIIGIVLLILQIQFEQKQKEKYIMIDTANTYKLDAEIYSEYLRKQADSLLSKSQGEANLIIINSKKEADELLEEAKSKARNIKSEAKKNIAELNAQINSLSEKNDSLKQELQELTEEIFMQYTLVTIDESITSEEYKSKYNLLVLQEKELSRFDQAVIKKSSEISKRIIDNDVKQLLRCFNSETSAALSSITVKNIDTVKSKIIKIFESLNKLFTTDEVELSKKLLEIKLQEADLLYSYEYQKEQEKLQQKAIREQMVEEEKVRREIEKEKAKVEKEEIQFKNEIKKLIGYMQKSTDVEKQLYIDKIKELEEKLKQVEHEKEDVLNREKNTRAGFVYVISNIGSFGENVYKIGMTRRLQPMDRINELGSASVPFEFDVHALIFSEDAPSLENALHSYFESCKVNKVNPRKEFFKVSLDEIERVVKENYNGTVEFTKIAEAYQYRESLRIAERKN